MCRRGLEDEGEPPADCGGIPHGLGARPAVRQPSLYEKFTPGARRGGYHHTQARLASFASYCQFRQKGFRYPDSISARVNPMSRSTRSPRAAKSRRSRLRECQISSVSMAPRIVLVVRSGTLDRLSLLPEAVTIVGLLPCSAPRTRRGRGRPSRCVCQS